MDKSEWKGFLRDKDDGMNKKNKIKNTKAKDDEILSD